MAENLEDGEVKQVGPFPRYGGKDLDPVATGRLGPAARERKRMERLGELREQLTTHAPKAIDALGDVVTGDQNPKVVPAATAILDRIGLGPSVKQEVEVTGSERLAILITQLEDEDVAMQPIANEAEE